MRPRSGYVFHALVVMVLFSGAATAWAADFESLLGERLAENVAYRQAVLSRRQAELRVAQLDEFYVPYATVGLGQAGITYLGGEDGGFQAFQVQPSLRFENVLGANVSLGLPLTVRPSPMEGQDSLSIGDPSLTVTRRVFEETDASLLSARAALIRAWDTERGAYADARIQLVSEVFDARSALRTLADTRTRLENAERIKDSSRDETALRDLTRQILTAERAVIQAERSLRSLDARIVGNADELYTTIVREFDRWIADLPESGTRPSSSATVDAQRLALAAAELRRSRSFLPYVPNPALTASLVYDRDENTLNWSLGVGFSVTLLDRGERAVASLERRENAEIERLTLDSAVESFDRSVTTVWEDLSLLDLDLRIQEIDLEVQREKTERLTALHAAGFATREALSAAELALSATVLQLERTDNNRRVAQLRALRFFD